MFFFFKQKTAYEIKECDWSSDVCSSDLLSKEHSKFIWVKKEEAKKLLAWEGQKKSVELIYNYYTYNRDLLNLVEINLK